MKILAQAVVLYENMGHSSSLPFKFCSDRACDRLLLGRIVKDKAKEDMSTAPRRLVANELMNGFQEKSLQPADMRLLSQTIYRQRRKQLPALPKSRMETLEELQEQGQVYKTNKGEKFVSTINTLAEIVMFTCATNLESLCEIDDIYLDGTFKSTPKFFEQVYIWHGCKNGNYVPLLFFLLPGKSEVVYQAMIHMAVEACSKLSFTLNPKTVRIDFEKPMYNALQSTLLNAEVLCCRFHLGQSWHRKIVDLNLGNDYKDNESEIGRWLHHAFGLQHLHPKEIEDLHSLTF